VDLVLETVTEDLALKRRLFASLDARVPLAVPIASNSSSLPISAIAEGLAGARRMVGAHYFMPAQIVPLVEVVLGRDTDPAVGDAVCALFTRLGKKPVLVRKDIPGFLANRIQHALMREALALIDAGVASPEDVDLAVRYSFGFRYAAVGPILQKEISGWDTVASAAAAIYPSLANTTTVPGCLAELVATGRIGMKAGHGFLPWPADAAAATQRRYREKLDAAFAILASDDVPASGPAAPAGSS
jgi:3-hydroxybutyryl-CoA dehydrogenase